MTDLPPNPKQIYGDLKVPMHLWPESATIYGSLAFKQGAEKYGPYNWRDNAVELMTYVGAARRHLAAWVDGEENAPDSGYPHLAHVLSCIAIMVDAIESGNAIDNRPPPGPSGRLLEEKQSSD